MAPRPGYNAGTSTPIPSATTGQGTKSSSASGPKAPRDLTLPGPGGASKRVGIDGKSGGQAGHSVPFDSIPTYSVKTVDMSRKEK